MRTAEQYAEQVSDLQAELYAERGINARPHGRDYIALVYEMALLLYDDLPQGIDTAAVFDALARINAHTGAEALRLALQA